MNIIKPLFYYLTHIAAGRQTFSLSARVRVSKDDLFRRLTLWVALPVLLILMTLWSSAPAQAGGPDLPFQAISAGGNHTCGLSPDGSLLCWGSNFSGQMTVPALPAGLTYTQVSAGLLHTCGLRSDGSLLCWGDNFNGQTTVPALPAGVTYTQVSGGFDHTCGLRSDGSLLCWGDNGDSQTTVPALLFGRDTTSPVVSRSVRADANPTNAASVAFTVTFSEFVVGVNAADFTLTTSGLTGAAISGVSGSGKDYTVTVSTGTGSGALRLDVVADDTIRDAVNLPLSSTFTSGESYTVDTTSPKVTVEEASGQADPTSSSPINFTATFSEAINTSTFDASDITLGGTAPGTLTAVITQVNPPNDDTTFNIAISGMSGSGTVTASIDAGKVQDIAGNLNTVSTSLDNEVTYDNSVPSVTVEEASGQADPTAAAPINFTATFSEAINTSTFTGNDITFGGTAPGTLTAVITQVNPPNDDTTFNIAISGMTGSGTVTASIAAGQVEDIVGNTNTASTSVDNEVTYDNAFPAVLATSLQASYTNTGPATFTVTFSKDVSDAGGGTLTNDVTNPSNYLLVEAGANGSFDTSACNTGLQPDDSQSAIGSVSYDNATFIATVTLADTLPIGSYRLFICGTTSIVDLAGNHLNDGSDHIVDFVVEASTTTTANASSLPATGFRHGEVTQLPNQPAAKAYTDTAMTLEIPKLGISMPIVGVAQSGSEWDVTWLGNSAGYLYGSAFPTWAGNTVITGHVWDAYNRPGAFAEIKTLKYGDQVQIQAWGQTYTYEVRESKLVTKKNTNVVFQSEQYDWLTLVTCEFYNPFNGEYLFRRAVRAVLVSVQ